MKKIFGIVLVAFLTSISTYVVARKYLNTIVPVPVVEQGGKTDDVQFASYTPSPDGTYVNLEDAAEKSSRAVVHIKTETKARAVQYRSPFGDDFFDQFFGGGPRFYQQPQQSSGSGVIITADGYIVTNNHVVDGADQVNVVLNNKKTYTAKVIGNDASTDLALLKINESNLPFISFGNSDDVKLGQWVLAVGYPLTLETTVTAGIVSAKYRNIGINQSKSGSNAIESFIQTDAAVNPGNSGGALVNSRGELIGINSAIASPTGSYAGYSFAIPANIVRKVTNDMMKYGNVQRAYLGVGYLDTKNASPEQISAYGLDKIDGIYLNQVYPRSSAEDAGLKEGDIITKINAASVKTGPQMMEQIAMYRPGDEISITFLRNGKAYESKAKLKNSLGNTDVVKASTTEKLGATLRDLKKTESQRLGVPGGVLVSEIKSNGWIAKQTRMKVNFIITQVNEKEVNSIVDLEKILSSGEREFQLGGIYPNYRGVYYYMITTE